MSLTDESAARIDARTAAASWRPQQFSDGRPGKVQDPIIEPIWEGLRVLALVDGGRVTFRDLDGDPVVDMDDIASELIEDARASQLLVDGYLTDQPIRGVAGVVLREPIEAASAPSIGQMFLGSLAGGRGGRRELQADEPVGRDALPPDSDIALVAVDILWLDDEPMLDVPLLERKRILESVLDESQLVRRGTFVHPPIDPWVGSWRSFGFSRLAYKGANSRYTPGTTNPQWAIADIPSR